MATRLEFDRRLRRLQDEILVLGSMVEGAIMDSMDVLKERDMSGSRRLIAYDERVNEKRFAIEDEALTLIATQQPMAGDLRVLAAVIEIITELERIGDYAKGIARINIMLGEEPLVKPLEDLPVMAEKSRDMLHEALNAFIDRDADRARAIAAEDDVVDSLYNRVFKEIIGVISANPSITDKATYLLWAAHNLERTGDRVVNICERVIFMKTGDMMELGNAARIDAFVDGVDSGR